MSFFASIRKTIREYLALGYGSPSWEKLCQPRLKGGIGLLGPDRQQRALQVQWILPLLTRESHSSFLGTYLEFMLSLDFQSTSSDIAILFPCSSLACPSSLVPIHRACSHIWLLVAPQKMSFSPAIVMNFPLRVISTRLNRTKDPSPFHEKDLTTIFLREVIVPNTSSKHWMLDGCVFSLNSRRVLPPLLPRPPHMIQVLVTEDPPLLPERLVEGSVELRSYPCSPSWYDSDHCAIHSLLSMLYLTASNMSALQVVLVTVTANAIWRAHWNFIFEESHFLAVVVAAKTSSVVLQHEAMRTPVTAEPQSSFPASA
ncbi:hypothetical protein CLU79DRAFT_840671 [Phycomyces nitens]|nr:hypothetical protein CLU79DRAFT_840671 [Phycomyces nitens]